MLLIKTKIGPSTIEGIGLFADEEIHKDTVLWEFNPIIDKIISNEELGSLPVVAQNHIDKFLYFNDGNWVLCGDYAIFTNHSENPNIISVGELSVAARDIKKGEEITDDYTTYDEEPLE